MRYEIDIRDKDGNLYVDSNGVKVVRNDFAFERNVRNDNTVKEICEDFSFMLEAISKKVQILQSKYQILIQFHKHGWFYILTIILRKDL